jgi:hypothetical protein
MRIILAVVVCCVMAGCASLDTQRQPTFPTRTEVGSPGKTPPVCTLSGGSCVSPIDCCSGVCSGAGTTRSCD